MVSWFRKKKAQIQPDPAAAGLNETLSGSHEGARLPADDLFGGELDPDMQPLDIETLPFPESEPEGILADSARMLSTPAPNPAISDHGLPPAAQAPALAFYAGDPDAPGTTSADQPAASPAEADLVVQALDESGLSEQARTITLAAWSSVLERHGGVAGEDGWKDLLRELRRRRLRAPALAVAEKLAASQPGALWPLTELARLHAPADHVARLEVGQRLCARFPHAPEGPKLVVQSLLGLDRRDDAERFYAGLPEGFADQDWYLTTGMRLARARDDVPRVLALAERLRAGSPDRPLAYAMPATLLRQAGRLAEAEAVAASGVAACPGSADMWREAALTAQALGDTALAFRRWEGLRVHVPDAPLGYVGAVLLAERLRQPGTVRALVDDGLRAFPDERDLLVAKARASAEAGDWDDATARWSALIASAPDEPAIRVAAATALMGPAEGRAARLPSLLALLEEAGALFPDHVPAGIAHLRLLREAGQLARAHVVGEAWAARFPDNQGLAAARSRIAALDGQPDRAVAILQAARAVSPRTALLEAAYARALSVAGRAEEADQVCTQALAGLPGDVGLLAERTRIAMRREDWHQALSRAEQAIQARPQDATLQGMLVRVKAQGAAVDNE